MIRIVLGPVSEWEWEGSCVSCCNFQKSVLMSCLEFLEEYMPSGQLLGSLKPFSLLIEVYFLASSDCLNFQPLILPNDLFIDHL